MVDHSQKERLNHYRARNFIHLIQAITATVTILIVALLLSAMVTLLDRMYAKSRLEKCELTNNCTEAIRQYNDTN